MTPTPARPQRYKFVKDEDMQAQYDMVCECCMIEASSGQYVSLAAYDAVAAERDELARQRGELRQRVEQAEKAARATIDECRRQGVSVGRSLANYGLKMAERERDAAVEEAWSTEQAWKMADMEITLICEALSPTVPPGVALRPSEQVVALIAERDALRADADRWRYVRDNGWVSAPCFELWTGNQVADRLLCRGSAAVEQVDAARQP